MAKRIAIASTRLDYEPLIREVEAKYQLKYVLMGMFESPSLTTVSSALELENLGLAATGNNVLENQYMVVDADTDVKSREIIQKKGGSLYAVQVEHSAVYFEPGGLFDGRCLIIGSVGTDSDDPFALELMKLFRSQVKKRFTCINKSVWLGPEAFSLFEQGMRCTQSTTMPAEYDLSL